MECREMIKDITKRYRNEILLRTPPKDHVDAKELEMYKVLLSDFEKVLEDAQDV
ncbi:MAG: hypothetical protein RPU64_14225 [Candidatus Sedimenticola sp. (ex Thyasira tokunagai)]